MIWEVTLMITCQWRNRGAECPDAFHQEIFADLPGNRGKEKGEKKRRKIVEGKWKLRNGRVKKMSRGLFFCFSHFQTTKICLGSTKMKISTGKKHLSCWEKKSEKSDCAPPEKYSSCTTTTRGGGGGGGWTRLPKFKFSANFPQVYTWFYKYR